jgi:hypothetical protein
VEQPQREPIIAPRTRRCIKAIGQNSKVNFTFLNQGPERWMHRKSLEAFASNIAENDAESRAAAARVERAPRSAEPLHEPVRKLTRPGTQIKYVPY